MLDRTDLVGRLFFPPDDLCPAIADADDHHVEVDGGRLHLRIHHANGNGAVLLLFHGNGEALGTWNGAGRAFAKLGVRLAVVDYRGYGQSIGTPTLRHVFEDAPKVFAYVKALFPEREIALMGRSLGSAPAWEVAQRSELGISKLVIDSGFSDPDAFSKRRGIDPQELTAEDRLMIDPLPKAARVNCPVLLLHGEIDSAIAIEEAERVLESVQTQKTLVRLPGRGHNDLSAHPDYWRALRGFLIAS